jgi:peptidyl-prolyl cis-trans isomerase C
MYQATLDQPHEPRAEYRYHLLRAANERFQTSIPDLNPGQRAEAEHQAERTWALESLVLTTSEARDTLIPERHLAEAVAKVRGRYPSESAFLEDLERNGLDEAGLGRALQRELIFDAVMTRIGAQAEPVNEDDERRFHTEHRDRFETTEQRCARHILITINADYAENSREAACARIEHLAAELKAYPESFGQLARQHSECPTAMEDGRLGTLPRGRLYPELDTALFGLDEGQISGVIESEIGFHLLWCEHIEPARTVTFEHARTRIRTHLESCRRRECQKAWIAHLKQAKTSES